MSPRHGKTSFDDSPEALRESARKFAHSISARTSEDELARIGSAARMIAEGLLDTVNSGTPEEVASRVAMAIGALLAMVSRCPVNEVGETLDNTIAGYGLASAALVDVFTLPKAPEGTGTHAGPADHTPSRSMEDGELARPAGFRYL